MNKFYRVTYDGEGIYQAFKKSVNFKVWRDFIKSPAYKWLPKPKSYLDGYESYFTEYGYMLFVEKTLPEMEKYLDQNRIDIEVYDKLPSRVIYKDRFQIIIDKIVYESEISELLLDD